MPKKPTNEAGWEYIATLAGSLAHEIKNPLSTINLNLQLLEEDLAAPKTPHERRTARKLHVVQAEVQRLAQILDGFLRFVRVDTFQPQPTDINELAAEIAEFIEPELDRAKIRLREQYATGLRPCMADSKLLKQAILNLILNGQQAMPGGGELILRTSQAGRNVVIEVIDTGSGIAEPVRTRVFDAFFSTKPAGSGLGLAVARRILDLHRGTISFLSEPGKGTDFTLTLPAAPDPPAQTGTGTAP